MAQEIRNKDIRQALRISNSVRKGSLRASTLVEVLVALVIGIAAFSVGMIIYLNVVKSASVEARVDTRLYLSKLVEDYKKGAELSDGFSKYKGLDIEFTVNPYKDMMDVDHIRVVAVRSDSSVVAELNELILVNERGEEDESL